MTEPDYEALADEAERGYDVSDQPPTLPTVWLAELVSEGDVKGRVVLTTRAEADQALAGKWRVVRYVRADMSTAAPATARDYNVQCNVGKARYVVNFHDGVKTHADGSKFYDIRIASTKRELNAIVAELRRSGYTER